MGRRRTRLILSEAQQAEARRHVLTSKDRRDKERLRVVLLAATGEHTLADLACRADRSRSTIQNWLRKYVRGGIDGLLQREAAPGATSPIACPRVLTELEAGLATSRWKSAAQVADWLNREHGIRRARKTIYYWLRKNGWTAPQGRPPRR